MVMVLVLFVLGNLIFLSAFASTALNSFSSKIDISVYFRSDAPEENILSVKHDLETLSDVQDVAYISKEEALNRFREEHKDNALIAGALNELGDNPLLASVSIKARDSSKYASISEFLVKKNYPIVEKIDYFENQKVIDRLSSVIGGIRISGAILEIILAFIAILVAFNTIRLAIYTMREEIRIMRLVGATSWFIRGPFLINGFLYGVFAAIVTTLIFFPLTWALSAKLRLLLPNFDLFNYFLLNLFEFFAIMLATGMVIGVVSSFIAIRRYLEA